MQLLRIDVSSMNDLMLGYQRHDGVDFKFEGLDAVLESIYKDIVVHIPADATKEQYNNAFANYGHLRKIKDAFQETMQSL